MTVEFCTALAEDIPTIVDMKLDMFAEFGYDQHLHEDARQLIVEDYRQLHEDNRMRHFLSREHNQIVAMAGAFIKSDIPYRYFSNSQYGFIGDVYTLPAYRHRGISKMVNQSAVSWLREYGVDSIRLLASDAGRPIYKESGFVDEPLMVLNFETE